MRRFIVALAAALAALPAAAHDVTKDGITVVHPSARPVLAGRPVAAYMAIANDGEAADRLIDVRAPAFEAAELHESYDEGGIARMRLVETLEIPAGDAALLEPGGLHLMLFGAARALKEGEEFPLVLVFERAGEIEVPVMVEAIGPTAAGQRGHDTGHGAGHGATGGAAGHGGHAAPATQ